MSMTSDTDASIDFTLDGQCAVITGGLGILGQKLARGFREAGARVALVDIADDTPTRAQKLFPDADGLPAVRGYALDLARADTDGAAVVDAISDELGPVTHLLANAASKGSDPRKFMEGPNTFSPQTWREVMSVNLDGTFFFAREIAHSMKSNGTSEDARGSMTFVSSIYGLQAPRPDLYEGSFFMGGAINTPPIYSASKSGVLGLVKYLAAYWGADGIRVNALTPGGVESGQNATFTERYSSRVPMGRMAKAEEMVGPAIFLASSAASYINGANIVVDGGFSIW